MGGKGGRQGKGKEVIEEKAECLDVFNFHLNNSSNDMYQSFINEIRTMLGKQKLVGKRGDSEGLALLTDHHSSKVTFFEIAFYLKDVNIAEDVNIASVRILTSNLYLIAFKNSNEWFSLNSWRSEGDKLVGYDMKLLHRSCRVDYASIQKDDDDRKKVVVSADHLKSSAMKLSRFDDSHGSFDKIRMALLILINGFPESIRFQEQTHFIWSNYDNNYVCISEHFVKMQNNYRTYCMAATRSLYQTKLVAPIEFSKVSVVLRVNGATYTPVRQDKDNKTTDFIIEGNLKSLKSLGLDKSLVLKSLPISPDDYKENSVPTTLLLMQSCLYDQGGLKAEGIFRIKVDNRQEEYARERLNGGMVQLGTSVHCLAGLIKDWFIELPSGVLDSLFEEQEIIQCQTEEECAKLARLLPPMESALLKWAINLMADVVQNEHFNKMNARNIAMVFAPNMTKMADPLTSLTYTVQVMYFLMTLISRTLREREDSVVDPALASRLSLLSHN